MVSYVVAEANCTSWLVNEVCYSDDDEHENKWCALIEIHLYSQHLAAAIVSGVPRDILEAD